MGNKSPPDSDWGKAMRKALVKRDIALVALFGLVSWCLKHALTA